MRATSRASSLVVALLLPLAGCTAITNFGAFHGGGSPGDAGIDAAVPPGTDGGPRPDTGPGSDAGPSPDTGPSACSPACSGADTCCGTTCVDLTDDPLNCLRCGNVCPDRDNATPFCDSLGCAFDCELGFDDCDAEDSNGCEQRLNTADACGSCDVQCTGSTPVCSVAMGRCVSGCTGSEMDCDGTCVDVSGGDVTHCGSCTTVCETLPGTSRICAASRCVYACTGGFLDCNGDLNMTGSDGCETAARTYYTDADHDGYGTGAGMMGGCTAPSGTSETAGDCNDGDASVHPGATETCNATNDDCDANVDEGLAYMGVGVGGACSCEAGAASGTVRCVTGAAQCAFPTEVCNGADDDCDGSDDEDFMCVRGATSTCSMSLGFCTYVGTRTCDGSCNWGACTPPAETCNGNDDDCDGFVDEGVGMLRPAVGGFSDGMPYNRFVAAAWRDASRGGAALLSRDGPGFVRQLTFRTFDATGAPTGSPVVLATQTMAEMTAGLGVNVPAAIAWDGSSYVIFYMFFTGTGGGSIRRVVLGGDGTGDTSGVTESTAAMGMTSVAVSRAPSGDIGVVFGTPNEIRAGVWRAGAWARVPAPVISGRTGLDYAQVAAVGMNRWVALSSEPSGVGQAIYATPFDSAGTPASVYSYLNGGAREIDTRVAFEANSGRLVVTFRDASTGVPSVGLIDPSSMSFVGSVMSLGTSSNGPRVDAANGEVYVGVQPDFRRVRPDTGAPYTESFDTGWYTDVVLATPGATQRALTFAYALAPLDGPATRRFTCP